MRRLVIVLVLLVASAIGLGAQPPTFTITVVRVGTPFTVTATHPEAEALKTTGYRVRRNNVVIATATREQAWANGRVQVRVAQGLPAVGVHVLTLGAYNAAGEGISGPIVVTVGRKQ